MERRELFEKTKAAFADLQTRNKRCQYPAHLKEEAIALLEHYPISRICDSLGITEDRLQRWVSTKNQRTTETPHFMRLTLGEQAPSIPDNTANETITLILHLPHQCSLSLSNQPVKSVKSLVCAMLKEVMSCSI